MEGVAVEDLERVHVHSVYSQIAPHFSDTRYKPWPTVADFLLGLPEWSLVADIGCGNGKYLSVNTRQMTIGSDICPELVKIAKARQHEVLQCDCLQLPYRTGAFDAVICIAVVHHLASEERRGHALQELARIVRPGGQILVYVWAQEQSKKKFLQQDVMVDWHLQPKYLKSGISKESAAKHEQNIQDDCHVDKQSCSALESSTAVSCPTVQLLGNRQQDLHRQGYQTFKRYYHVFQKGELSRLFINYVSNVQVKEEYYDHANWCVRVNKIH